MSSKLQDQLVLLAKAAGEPSLTPPSPGSPWMLWRTEGNTRIGRGIPGSDGTLDAADCFMVLSWLAKAGYKTESYRIIRNGADQYVFGIHELHEGVPESVCRGNGKSPEAALTEAVLKLPLEGDAPSDTKYEWVEYDDAAGGGYYRPIGGTLQ